MGVMEMILRQREILNTARREGRDLTPEETKEFDDLQKKIDVAPNDGGGDRNLDPSGNGGGEERGAGNPDSQEDIAQRAVTAERERISEISGMCREFGLDASRYVERGISVEDARKEVLNELKKSHSPIDARVTADEGDKFRSAAVDGILMRGNVNVEKPAEGASDFRNFSLRALGEECLIRSGMDGAKIRRMSNDELYTELGQRQFYNPSSAFPAILDATARKSIVQMYKEMPTTFEKWVTEGTKSDFKEDSDHEYVINSIGDFEEVPESGELKHGEIKTELLPTRKLKTYGKQFTMNRQAFINDDIGIVTRMPGLYAARAKKTIDKLVYQVIFQNEKTFDGVKLFEDANHHNLLTPGSAPTREVLQKMIMKLSLMKDQFGEAIYATPKAILVPVGYSFDLYTILHSALIPGSNNNDANPLYNYKLDVIETPVLNAMAGTGKCPWFLVADRMTAASIGVDYLNGQKIPTVRRMETPGQLGFVWDVYLDAGIWVKDYRGIVRNDGVALS